jgi:hypothetical protein
MKYLLTSIFFLVSLLAFAQNSSTPQIPQGINYQAIARDAAGDILPNYTLTVSVRIIDAPVNGNIVYTEQFVDVSTDNFGLLNLVLGQGSGPGNFDEIDWIAEALFLELTLVLPNETVVLPATPFQSVPYALAAGTSLDGRIWTRIGDSAFYEDGNVGIGTDTPERSLHVAGSGNQFIRVATTDFSSGTSTAGLEMNRGNVFSSTDHRMINQGGRLRFQSTQDNFTGESGELNDNLAITSGGSVGIGVLNPESKLALHDSEDVGLTIRSTGTQMAYLDLLRGEENSLSDWRIVNRQGSLSFRNGNGIGEGTDEGEGVMFLNTSGRLAMGNFSAAAAKIHVRGTEDQRIRIESTDGPASIDLYSTGEDYRMVNDDGRLSMQRSGNSFGVLETIFDIRDDATFRFRQNVDMDDQRIVNVADPEGPQQVVNRRYLEDYVAAQMDNQSFFPEQLSSEAQNMTFAGCANRCRTLTEGGFTNWGVPSLDQLSQFAGGIVGDPDFTWTSSGAFAQKSYAFLNVSLESFFLDTDTDLGRYAMRLNIGVIEVFPYDSTISCRCVR